MLFGFSEEGVSDVGVVSPPADLVIGKGAMTNEILAYDFFDLLPSRYRVFSLATRYAARPRRFLAKLHARSLGRLAELTILSRKSKNIDLDFTLDSSWPPSSNHSRCHRHLASWSGRG